MSLHALHGKVAKWGNSLALRIPRDAVKTLGLTDGSDVTVVVKDQSMTIRRTRRITTLDDLLKGVTQRNSGGEIDFGSPVGREVW